MEIKIIKNSVKKSEVENLAKKGFGDMIKAVVDVESENISIGGELHVDMEIFMMENSNSLRSNTWGINLYPSKDGEEFIEFDSMINLKPAFGNRTRNVEDLEIQEKIKRIVKKFILK